MKAMIQVLDCIGQEVLKEFPPEELEQAYTYASEMEKLGLEVTVKVPHSTRTLADSLGVAQDQIEGLEQEFQEEIESHNDSCCHKFH